MRRLLSLVSALLLLAASSAWAQDGVWSDFPPPWRTLEGLHYEASTDHVIMFAGNSENQNSRSDVWEGPPGGEWVNVSLGASPAGPVQVFDDPPRGRVIAIVNNGTIYFLDAVTHFWQHLSQPSPPSRSGYSLAFDSRRNRLLLVGGGTCLNCPPPLPSYFGDVWQLPLSGSVVWTQLTPGGPMSARSGARVVYDPHGDRLLIQGGSAQSAFNDAWSLSLDSLSWQQITTTSPGGLGRAMMDTRSDRMLFIGSPDTWALSPGPPASWDLVASVPASQKVDTAHGMAFDSTGNRVLVFPPLWSLDLSPTSRWSLLDSLSRPTSTPTNHSAYDPDRDRMILWNNTGGITSVWELPLSPGGDWRRLAITDSGPTLRDSCTTTFDPIGQRLIVFGEGSGVWQLPLVGDPVWSLVPVSGGPPETRQGESAIYDPVAHRIVVFGGRDGSVSTNQVWTLDLGPVPSWSLATTSGGPPTAGFAEAAIYDPVRLRMIVLGGPGFGFPAETWALSLADMSWTKLAATGPVMVQSSIYDPIADRMVAFGGAPWAFPLATNSGWTTLSPGGEIPAGDHANVIYDSRRDRAAFFDIVSFTHTLNWGRVSLTGITPKGSRFALEAPYPNPAAHGITLAFDLTGGTPARLDVFDVSGRLASSRDLSGLGPGHHTASLGGEKSLSAGVYVVRLHEGERSASVKAVLVK